MPAGIVLIGLTVRTPGFGRRRASWMLRTAAYNSAPPVGLAMWRAAVRDLPKRKREQGSRPWMSVKRVDGCPCCRPAPAPAGVGGSAAETSGEEDSEEASCPMDAVKRARFDGVEQTYGAEGLQALARAHVCVLGIGGVGSWAAEAVARSGVGRITMVDLDEVCISNVNRQVHALQGTVGRPKGEVMRERIAGINPACEVALVHDFLDEGNFEEILSAGFDFVIDAIDQPKNKCRVIAYCYYNGIAMVSSGGVGSIDNPYNVRLADLNDTSADGLLLRVRKSLRKQYGFPKVSKAPWGIPVITTPGNAHVNEGPEGGRGVPTGSAGCAGGAGSVVFVTGTLGFFAASHCVNEIVRRAREGASGGGGGSGGAGALGPQLVVGDGIDAAPWRVSDKRPGKDAAGAGEGGARVAQGEEAEALGGGAMAAGLGLFDAHSHLHLDPRHEAIIPELTTSGIALMATLPEEWGTLASLAAAHPTVRPGYGVHPYYAHREEFQLGGADGGGGGAGGGGWIGELRAVLEAHPLAVVGEFGLDKHWVPPGGQLNEIDAQRGVFSAQLDLAAELGRPACLHCVRAYGELYKMLSDAPRLPPRIYLHSYTGSAEMVQSFTGLSARRGEVGGTTVYFGFSHAVNSRSHKTPGMIRAVPDHLVLLESDASAGAGVERELVAMLAAIAGAKGWSLPEAAAATRRNAEAFFSTCEVVA